MTELYFNVSCHKKFDLQAKKRPLADELGVQQRCAEKIEKLKGDGNVKQANFIRNKIAWNNAFLKLHGAKVKDNTNILEKLIKRRNNKKKNSKAAWSERLKIQNKKIQNKQLKRKENIDKKKQLKRDRKTNKKDKGSKMVRKTKNGKKSGSKSKKRSRNGGK